jgi:hypothetical protein
MFINRYIQHEKQAVLYCITVLLFIMLCLPFSLVAQQKHALLIGISDYPQYDDTEASWAPIHGTNDIQLIAPILTEQGFVINTLTNEAATRQAIDNSFKELESRVKAGNIVYIHLSGHGQAVEDEDGDEADGWDEAFIPFDAERTYRENGYHGENHLLDDELNGYLNSIRRKIGEEGVVYVVLDACHAGSAYRGEEDDDLYERGTNEGFSKTGKPYLGFYMDKRKIIKVENHNDLAPIYMLEACRHYQVNTEIKQDGVCYGPLSYYISQQLLTMQLSYDTKWIEEVSKSMNKDTRLSKPRRQDMVIESSK